MLRRSGGRSGARSQRRGIPRDARRVGGPGTRSATRRAPPLEQHRKAHSLGVATGLAGHRVPADRERPHRRGDRRRSPCAFPRRERTGTLVRRCRVGRSRARPRACRHHRRARAVAPHPRQRVPVAERIAERDPIAAAVRDLRRHRREAHRHRDHRARACRGLRRARRRGASLAEHRREVCHRRRGRRLFEPAPRRTHPTRSHQARHVAHSRHRHRPGSPGVGAVVVVVRRRDRRNVDRRRCRDADRARRPRDTRRRPRAGLPHRAARLRCH